MRKGQEKLLKTEDAVATIGGLTTLLSYVNEVASADDAQSLRDPVGFALNAIGREVRRAQKGVSHLGAALRGRPDRNGPGT